MKPLDYSLNDWFLTFASRALGIDDRRELPCGSFGFIVHDDVIKLGIVAEFLGRIVEANLELFRGVRPARYQTPASVARSWTSWP